MPLFQNYKLLCTIEILAHTHSLGNVRLNYCEGDEAATAAKGRASEEGVKIRPTFDERRKGERREKIGKGTKTCR